MSSKGKEKIYSGKLMASLWSSRGRERIKNSPYRYIPVVLGSNATALGIVRSLGEHQLPVIVADCVMGMAFYSKYAIPVLIPDYAENKEDFLRSLYRIAAYLKLLNKEGILYCSYDIYVFAVGENLSKLKSRYKVTFSDWGKVNRCLDKSYLYQEAKRLHIPCPKTSYAQNSDGLFEATKRLSYPLIIKPAITIGFSSVYRKAIQVEDEEELLRVKDEIEQHGLGHCELVLQEMIPGPVKYLYTFSSYSDLSGDVKGYSIGHKLRQSPPDTGTITAGRVIHRPNLAKLGSSFIKGLGYHGIANTEFKLDPRDRKYKLIEINPRPGLWNYSATASGVNLSWIAYQNIALGIDAPVKYSDKKLIWVYDLLDVIRAVCSSKYGHDRSRISLLQWLRSIRGDKVFAIWQRNDPMPFVFYVISLLCRVRK